MASRRGAAITLGLMVTLTAACRGGADRTDETSRAPEAPRPAGAALVPRRDQEAGLTRCGEVLSRIEAAGATPTFARLARECSGLFARRGCRDALDAAEFSRDAVAAACREAYCTDLRPAPGFCTIDMPTDAEFLVQFGDFSRRVLRRDLDRIMERDGAREIAELYGGLVDAQAAQQ